MTETLTKQSVRNVCVGDILSVIEAHYGVECEIDGLSISISGDNERAVSGALRIADSLAILSENGDIDSTLAEYLCGLQDSGQLDDFVNGSDELIFTTPTGRPVKAKTLGQRFYIDALKRQEVVISYGPAGTGKTFLGVAMAVRAFKNKEVSKIILARPAVEAGEKLGFLPGDLEEKVDPYMRPLYDALELLLGVDQFEKYMEKGLIEVSPLAFMRGRNLDDAFVLLDEAQNTSIEQMKMFLTRLGLNSRACVCGDFTQVDLPRGMKSGLRDAIDVLKDIQGIAIVNLGEADIVRSPLVRRIVKAYSSRDLNEVNKD